MEGNARLRDVSDAESIQETGAGGQHDDAVSLLCAIDVAFVGLSDAGGKVRDHDAISHFVRLAGRVLESSRKELSLARCRSMFQRWMNAQPERSAPTRVPMTDEDVRGFIRVSLARNPRLRPTPLL